MSQAAGTKTLPIKAIISWIVTILVPVILLLIPTSETYTSELRIFFALTICAILMFAFDQVHSAIPALLLPLAYAVTGIVDFGAPPWPPGPSRWSGPSLAVSCCRHLRPGGHPPPNWLLGHYQDRCLL